jgi:hypothetical protein
VGVLRPSWAERKPPRLQCAFCGGRLAATSLGPGFFQQVRAELGGGELPTLWFVHSGLNPAGTRPILAFQSPPSIYQSG